MTARELIKGSLRLIGAIATGETPSADEQADALSALNGMVDSWSNERLIIFQVVREEFTLTPGDGDYTIGSSGNFNTARPQRIENATIEDQSTSPTQEYPLNILNPDQWAMISPKDLSAAIPTDVHLDDAYPLGTIYIWPAPTVANKLVIYSWKVLATFANANTSISLPPGYERALRFNLAIELAPEYGRTASAETVTIATESKETIKRMNIKPQIADCDPAVLNRGSSNIYRGN